MYFCFITVAVSLLTMVLSLFGLKMVLKMVPTNPIMIILTFEVIFVAAPGVLEIYLYANYHSDTIGHYATAFFIQMIFHYLIIFKSRGTYFDSTTPLNIRFCFTFICLFLFIFPVFWFGILKKGTRR